MIELTDVCVRFGKRTILQDISLHIAPRRTVAILGPNGRGKTTLLRTILGQQKLSHGTRRNPAIVGYVPQAVALSHPYRAIDVVVMGRGASLGLFGCPGPKEQQAALEAMQQTGVAHLANAPFDKLSGGERQLVMVARALTTGAEVLLLDEPSSALDLQNTMRLLDLLQQLGREEGKTIVFTTHDPNHALAIADDAVLMMPDGSISAGSIGQTLVADNLSRLYGIPMQFVSFGSGTMTKQFAVPDFSFPPTSATAIAAE